ALNTLNRGNQLASRLHVEMQDFGLMLQAIPGCNPDPGCGGSMAKVERIREVVTGSVDLEYVRQKTENGWKLVAMEWRREIAGDETEQPIIVEEIPYGLRVASDCSRLEEDPQERDVLVQMMELIVQDYSITLVASELNKRGLRTRTGSLWTPVSVFNMLPRLIEVGPHIFTSDEWEARREHLLKLV